MPTNLLKTYNQLLELLYHSTNRNLLSLRAVFNRDFVNGQNVIFNNYPVRPTPTDGIDAMDRLFDHLTTVITNEVTRKRTFETERSIRLHWIKHHLENRSNHLLVFKLIEENRIYILDDVERYVVILEPLRNVEEYYILTAYRLEPSNYRKLRKKYESRGEGL